jgi:hypothetical protein
LQLNYFILQIYQEAVLTWKEYCKTPHSDYVPVEIEANRLPEKIESVFLSWYEKVLPQVKRYREAASLLKVEANTKGKPCVTDYSQLFCFPNTSKWEIKV